MIRGGQSSRLSGGLARSWVVGVDLGFGVVDLGEASSVEDVEADVAAAFGPFVVLFGKHGTDQPDQRFAVGKMPTTSVRRQISRLSRSWGCWTRFAATAPCCLV